MLSVKSAKKTFALKQKLKGFNLLEVVIVTAFLLFFLVVVIQLVSLTAKNTVRALNTVIIQKDLRHAQMDIAKNISNSTWNRFACTEGPGTQGIYYFGDDARHPLLIQSAMNDDGTINADKDMIPILKKYTLYYIVRPPGDTCAPAVDYNNTPALPSPDVYCPHKWLVKKEIKTCAFCLSPLVTLEMLKVYMSTDFKDTVFDNILSQKILAENVIDFTITPPADGSLLTIYYNGTTKSVNSGALSCQLVTFKDKKYFVRFFSNENLLNENQNLFSLNGKAEPKN